MSTLIRGGIVCTADAMVQADVLVQAETVAAIGGNLQGQQVLDASGKFVIPGGVDVHTHFAASIGPTFTSDDYESGTRAAAYGGTTTCVNFATALRGVSPRTALEQEHRKAAGKAAVDYAFHMALTEMNEQTLAEMDHLARYEGVTSFKLYMAYRDVLMMDDEGIFKALRKTAENGALIQAHAENGSVIDQLVLETLARGQRLPRYHATTRPAAAEAEATNRAVALAEIAGAPLYVVHLSCSAALDVVRAARDRGLPVYAETCPHYLLLNESRLELEGFEGAKFVCSPPLRPVANHEDLWRGLAHDDLQVISTDHCPFCFREQKALGRNDFSQIPNGLPGVETRMSLIYDRGVASGKISMMRYVALTATAPAKLFGLYPRKGTIAPGSDADIVLLDPRKTATISAQTHHMRVDYNPYEGWEVTGVPTDVLLRGKAIVREGVYTGCPGDGQFIPRSLFQLPRCQ